MKLNSFIPFAAIGLVICLMYGFKMPKQVSSTKTNSSKSEAVTTFTTPVIPKSIGITPSVEQNVSSNPNAGIYVNDFDLILGNSVSETALLNWCNTHNFKTLNLSKIASLASGSSSIRTQLNAFIGLAKSITYNKKIYLIVSSAVTAGSVQNKYYDNPIYTNKYDGYLTEYEFWNTSSYTSTTSTCPTFNEFANLTATLAAISATSPAIINNVYVSKFTDAACASSITNPACLSNSLVCQTNTTTIFSTLLTNYSRLYLPYYQSSAATTITSTMLTRLNELGAAANALGKVAKLEIIYLTRYSSGDPDIYNYFASTTTQNVLSSYPTPGLNMVFSKPYTNFVTNYNALTTVQLPYKNNLVISGYSIFRYTEAQQARP
jgi:hypothetical protein